MINRLFMRVSYLILLFAVTGFYLPAVYAQAQDKPVDVIVQHVMKHSLKTNIEAMGSLRANESVVLTAKTTKTITRIHFQEGQRVEKGQPLVDMTSVEESALLDEASANLNSTKKIFDRLKPLHKSGAVSPTVFDQAQGDYEAARSHKEALEARLSDLRILAPFAGVIGFRNVSVGSLVSPGQPMGTLNDNSKMKLDFPVSSVYLSHLRKGLPVEARTRDLNGKVFKGEVLSIDNQIDESTRSIKVRVLLDNAAQELTSGMLMNLSVHSDLRQALVISETALVPMASNHFVFVVKKNENEKNISWVVEKRPVKIGQRDQGTVEILSGLHENDRVVTHGLQKIRDGQRVNILAEQGNQPNEKPQTLSDLLQQKAH
jgi:membrane fusion protein, multidrug efflux system